MVVATADFAMNVLIDVSSMLVIIRTLLTGMMFLRKLGIIRVLKLKEPATQPHSVQVDTISEPVEKLRSEEKMMLE